MTQAPDPTEAEIVAGCKQGARWARGALFERYHRSLFRFLVAQCGDPALAEDLVQETFLVAFESIGDFRGEARVETWMTRIALNRFYATARRGKTGKEKIAEIEAGDPRAAWIRRRSPEPGSGMETRDLIRRALDRLDRDDASIILLHDLQGLRYREIAEILDVAIGTVGSRLSRARERLREILEQLQDRREESRAAEHRTSENGARGSDASEDVGPHDLGRLAWRSK